MTDQETMSGGSKALRLFVAICIPDSIKDRIEVAQQELRQLCPAKGFRWTQREQFHLTLHFLGDTAAEQVAPLAQALRETCVKYAPLALRAQGLGVFPTVRRARVLWAGIDEVTGRLSSLQQSVQATCCKICGAGSDSRSDFSAHVTLARVKSIQGAEPQALTQVLSCNAERKFGVWHAAQVELIKSQLFQAGAAYSTLESISLGSKIE